MKDLQKYEITAFLQYGETRNNIFAIHLNEKGLKESLINDHQCDWALSPWQFLARTKVRSNLWDGWHSGQTIIFWVLLSSISYVLRWSPHPDGTWLSKRVLRGSAWGGWFVGKWCQLSLLSAGWGNCLIRPRCCNHRVIITVSSRLKKIVNTTTPPGVWRETAQQLTKKTSSLILNLVGHENRAMGWEIQ